MVHNRAHRMSPKKTKSSPRSSSRVSPKRKTPRMSPKKVEKASDKKAVSELLSIMFHSRNQAHVFHLQTDSYAVHKALNNYYDGIVPLADKYAETYQGIYGIVKSYPSPKEYLEGDKYILPYFKKLDKQVLGLRNKLPKDLDLENAYADILDLIHSTQYLLTELH